MPMERTERGYRLSTGREIKAHLGIIGISPDEPTHVYDGYDGDIYEADPASDSSNDPALDAPPLSLAERCELADYMIERWTQYRAYALGEHMLDAARTSIEALPIIPIDYRVLKQEPKK